jgi:nicotinate-nucleotide adenylyltransferase
VQGVAGRVHTFPPARPGLRIGLLGGSFDPPHAGHVHITRQAFRAFRLDRVWWLVSPGNPLKPESPAALDRRIAAARALLDDRHVAVTDIEARLGTRYTAEMLDRLLPRYPGTRFVWLMGADNLASLHRWQRWESIMERVPVGVLARPGAQIRAGLSRAARRYATFRLPGSAAAALPARRPPAWCLVTGPMHGLSSTALRAHGHWHRTEGAPPSQQ